MSTPTTAIPSHVPPHLVKDFNLYFEDTAEHALNTWRNLHKAGEPEIFWTPHNGGHWVATRADDIEEVYSNYEHFTTFPRGNAIPYRGTADPHGPRPLPISSDPPEHTDYRRIISPFFTPKRIGEVEKVARSIAREIIDGLIDKGGCEFYGDFSMHLPIRVFLGIANLPFSDWSTIFPWAQDVVRSSDMNVVNKDIEDAMSFLKVRLDTRRNVPGDDPLSALVQGEISGRKLTENECLGGAMNVLFAGLDTVPATLSFIAHFLATHPEKRRQIIDNPASMTTFVEELLRRFPTSAIGRTVAKDIEYKGVTMKAGDPILAPSVAANLDDRRFPDPLTVDFTRQNLNRHLGFGAGAHRCIGSMLARMQVKVFLEEWLARIPDFRITPGEQPRVKCGTILAVVHLPLSW
jgi:cytochrome P450